MIDFVPETAHFTPLDYAYSSGSKSCSDLVSSFGGITSPQLTTRAASLIIRAWRNYKRNKASIQSKKSSRSQRRGSYSLKRRLSLVNVPLPIIENVQDSQEPEHEKTTVKIMETPTKLDQPSTNNARRFSTSGQPFLLILEETDMLNPESSAGKYLAVFKIQRAWRRYQLKIETKFLIQLMGPEEASQIVEKLIIKQHEKELAKINDPLARRKSRRGSTLGFPTKSILESRRSSVASILISNEENQQTGTLSLDDSTVGVQIGRRKSLVDYLKKNNQRHSLFEPNDSQHSRTGSADNYFLSPNFLGKNLNDKPVLSRAPTIYKISLSEDELSYFAMEEERKLLEP